MKDKKNLFWDYEDLVDSELFSNKQLQQIRDTLDYVIVNKKEQKIFTEGSNFEIFIWTNGNMTLCKKDSGELIAKQKC